MPTRERIQRAAEADEILDLAAAGRRVNYAPDYLRKLIWSDDPPPLFKHRGRWHARAGALDAWLAQREAEVAS